MKFTVDTKNFDEAIKWVSKSVAERQSIPSMSGIHMVLSGDSLKLSSTNGRTSSELVLTVSGAENGTMLVPGEAIRKIVPTLHKDMPIEFSSLDDMIEIKSGTAKFNLKTIPAHDFPLLPTIEPETNTVHVDPTSFIGLFKHVYRSISTSENASLLAGVRMEFDNNRLTFVGSDTFRLAVKTIKINSTIKEEIIVDAKALEQVCEAAKNNSTDIEMALVDSKIIFSIGDYKLIATLREGEYPSYRQLLPDIEMEKIEFNRLAMMNTVKRISIMGQITGAKSMLSVLLSFEGDQVKLSADTSDVGRSEESLPLNVFTAADKGALIFQLNYTYFGLALDTFSSEHIRLSYEMVSRGIIVTSVEQDEENVIEAICLLMPINIPA